MGPKQHLFSLVGSYDKRLNKKSMNSEEGYSDLTELMIIIGKSLINDKKTEKLGIDVLRLKEELILWRYYREGSVECFLLKDGKGEGSLINTGITSLFPLILGNYHIENLEQELGYFACQTKQESDNLVLFLLMGKVVHGVMNQEVNSVDSCIKILKEYLIHLNYNRIFQEVTKEKRMNKISFEKEKIRWIMGIDRISEEKLPEKKDSEGNNQILFIQSIHLFLKYDEKEHFFENMENLEVPTEAKLFSLLLMDLNKRKKESSSYQESLGKDFSFGTNYFLNEMDRYFTKLKKFEIIKNSYSGEKLAGKEYTDTKKLFTMKDGEKGKHPILKDFEITRKEVAARGIRLEVKTKSRNYTLKKPLAAR